jgi:hypothetical protein
MLERLVGRLSYANVMATIAVFLALGGGAYALQGKNTVDSGDIKPNAVTASDIAPDAVTASDIAPNSVGSAEIKPNAARSADVQDNGLTGRDIADQSGVDTCADSVRFGDLCVRVENYARPFFNAYAHCGNLDMRLPSFAEAAALVHNRTVPGIDEQELFWTDEYDSGTTVVVVNGAAGLSNSSTSFGSNETVCVTTPSS